MATLLYFGFNKVDHILLGIDRAGFTYGLQG